LVSARRLRGGMSENDHPEDGSSPELRDAQGRFRPGVSGCPGGRSRTEVEVRELAQANCPNAIARLVHLMENSKNERVVLAACEALLNRGCGTPRQSIDFGVGQPAPLAVGPISDEDAERIYFEMIRGSAS